MTPPFVDYYQILQAQESASNTEIRRAYRRLAKRYHPDLHPDRQGWALSQFRQIAEAYEVLGDPIARRHYDLRNRFARRASGLNIRRRMPWETEVQLQSRLVLSELLQGHQQEAIRSYEELRVQHEFSNPLVHLEYRDYLDGTFLLAEAYESGGDLDAALRLYEEVFKEEQDEPRTRFYYDELSDRLRYLYSSLITRAADAEKARTFYRKAVIFEPNSRNLAALHKKMAAALLALGELREAARYLQKAFQADPHLKGAHRICEQLHFTPGNHL